MPPVTAVVIPVYNHRQGVRSVVQRALSQLPRQGTSGPWVMAMDPNHDAQVLRHGPVADPCLVFDTASRPRHPVAAPKQVAVSA